MITKSGNMVTLENHALDQSWTVQDQVCFAKKETKCRKFRQVTQFLGTWNLESGEIEEMRNRMAILIPNVSVYHFGFLSVLCCCD